MRTGHKNGSVRIFYTMTICDLVPGERAVIAAVKAPARIKERLRALNIRPTADVLLLKVSFFKKTYLVQAGSMVVLRREAAECVIIRKA